MGADRRLLAARLLSVRFKKIPVQLHEVLEVDQSRIRLPVLAAVHVHVALLLLAQASVLVRLLWSSDYALPTVRRRRSPT